MTNSNEKKNFSLSSYILRIFFFCFVFEKMYPSLPMLVVMLFIHVGKCSNNRSQMFFKTGVIKKLQH